MATLPLLMKQVIATIRSGIDASSVKHFLSALVIAGLLSFAIGFLFRDIPFSGARYFTGLVSVAFILFITLVEVMYNAYGGGRTVYKFPYARFVLYHGSAVLLGCVLLLASFSEFTMPLGMIRGESAFTIWLVIILSMVYEIAFLFGKTHSARLHKRVYATWVALFIVTIFAPTVTGVFVPLSLLGLSFTGVSIVREIKINAIGILIFTGIVGACAAVGTFLAIQALPDFFGELPYVSGLSVGRQSVYEFASEMARVAGWLAAASFMVAIAPIGVIFLERFYEVRIILFWKAWVTCFISVIAWIVGTTFNETTNGISLAVGGVILAAGLALVVGFLASAGRASPNLMVSNIGGWFAKSYVRNAHIGAFIGLYLFFLRPSFYAATGDAAWSKWHIGSSPFTDLFNYWRLRNEQIAFSQYWVPLPNPFLIDWLILILFLAYITFKLYRFFARKAREELSSSNLLSGEALTPHTLQAKTIPEPRMEEQVDAQREFLDECLPHALLTEMVIALCDAFWPAERIIAAARPILTYKDRGRLLSLFGRDLESERLSALKRFKEEIITTPLSKDETPLSIEGHLVDRSLDDFVSRSDKTGLVVLCTLYNWIKGTNLIYSYYELINYKESQTILNFIPILKNISNAQERKFREKIGRYAIKEYKGFTI